MVKNFGEYDASRVMINDDICATAKGYELLSAQKMHWFVPYFSVKHF